MARNSEACKHKMYQVVLHVLIFNIWAHKHTHTYIHTYMHAHTQMSRPALEDMRESSRPVYTSTDQTLTSSDVQTLKKKKVCVQSFGLERQTNFHPCEWSTLMFVRVHDQAVKLILLHLAFWGWIRHGPFGRRQTNVQSTILYTLFTDCLA